MINWPDFKFPPINLWSKPTMTKEIQLQNKYFSNYISSRKPLTPEQYRIAKESYEAGFRDYRKFFNELNSQ
jgi:hypothetical protein